MSEEKKDEGQGTVGMKFDEAVDYLAKLVKEHKGWTIAVVALAGWIAYRKCSGKPVIPACLR